MAGIVIILAAPAGRRIAQRAAVTALVSGVLTAGPLSRAAANASPLASRRTSTAANRDRLLSRQRAGCSWRQLGAD